MNPDLPDNFDVVVIGTGLGESMVAAALSRLGKSVLHIDRNDYYGSQWATFTFDSILKWAKAHGFESNGETDAVNDSCKIPQSNSSIQNIEIRCFIPELSPKIDEPNDNQGKEDKDKDVQCVEKNDTKTTDLNKHNEEEVKPETVQNETEKTEQSFTGTEIKADIPKLFKKPNQQSSIVSQAKINQKSPDISLEDFKTLSRKFCLDTNPKFLFSAGPLVNAIIKANISHYSEFQLVNRILTCKDNKIIEVPCNRSDIFSSSFLSMIEKRTLMKFLTLCLEFDPELPTGEVAEYLEKPFITFLQSRRLSKNLQTFIIYSIAMVKPETSTLEGMKETCSFLRSLGKFGKSPFIWCLYGVGELPQAFCRMSAVFGSIYCLSKSPVEIKIQDDKCKQIVLEDHTVNCEFVVMERNYLPKKFVHTGADLEKVSKAILITNGSILPDDKEFNSFLTIPPLDGKSELVRVIEIGPTGAACPSGLFVVYLCCQCTDSALFDLEDYVNLLTETENGESSKPKLLWSLYFNEYENNKDVVDLPDNLFVTKMPGSSLSFKSTVEDAEEIFKKICPEGDFLMAVPNPEDILWEEPNDTKEDPKQNSEGEKLDADKAKDNVISDNK